MNRERRKEIKQVNNKIETIITNLEECKSDIESIQMDEEWAFDSLPEGFQEGIRGDDMQNAIDEMEDSIDKIDNIIKQLNDIKASLSIL